MEAVSFRKEKPKSPNTDEAGRADNRRADSRLPIIGTY
jgi:peptidoglycan-associated lipoprotein